MDLLFATIAGMMVPIQAGLNSQLKNYLGHPLHSIFVSLVVSIIATVTFILAARLPVPALAECSRAPWWTWLGGICGAILLLATTTLAPRLGSTSLVACIIAGQILCSLVLDQYGWIGYSQHALTVGRAAGVLLLSVGVFLILR